MQQTCFGGRAVPLISLFFIGIGAVSAQNTTVISGAEGLAVSVDSKGAYSISFPNPDWQFAGSVGYPLVNVTSVTAVDAAGHYSEISFDFQADVARYLAVMASGINSRNGGYVY
jgi:hypothetical protein